MADPVDLNVVFKKVSNQEPLNDAEHEALTEAWREVEDTNINGQTITSPDGSITLGEKSNFSSKTNDGDIEEAIARGTEEQFRDKFAKTISDNGEAFGASYKPDGSAITNEEAKNIYDSLTPDQKKEVYKKWAQNPNTYSGDDPNVDFNLMNNTLAKVEREQFNEQFESESLGTGLLEKYGDGGTSEADYQNTVQQQTQNRLDGNASQPAASPSAQDEKGKGNEVLGEGYGKLYQCYLLDAVTNITKEINNNGVYGDRLRRIRLDRPEKFFNTLGFPKDGEKLYKTNSGFKDSSRYKLYLVKDGEKLDVFQTLKKQTTVGTPNIDSIDVTFNGTNPASARSDIKVDISISVKANLSILNTKFDEPILHDGKKSSNDWKLIDLVVRPEFIREGGDIKAYERSQYHPEYNRCELVLTSRFTGGECVISNSISFGLTMVDHEIDYSITPAEGVKTIINLSYYSYIQSYLNLPYMDVLGGKKVLKERRAREINIQNAVVDGCDEASIHRAKKTLKIANIADIQANKSRIFETLNRNNLVWRTDVPDGQLEKVRTKTEKGDVGFSGTNLKGNVQKAKENFDKDTLDYVAPNDPSRYIYFVTLGDLICSLSDLFYKDEYTDGAPASGYDPNFTGKLEIKFLLLDLLVKDQSGKDVQVNIADIPIAMEWFGDFLLENYYKKEVQYASFMPFLRNLIEKAVSNMLKKTCFMAKPWTGQIRVTSFRALKTSWDRGGSTSTLSSARFQSGLKGAIFNGYVPESKMKSVGAQMGAIGKTEDDYYTYIIVHASNQNYQSELIKSVSTKRSEVEKEFPILVDMKKEATSTTTVTVGNEVVPIYGTNIGCFMAFKKTDSAGLRESRYFQYQADEFVAIGNVYDCTVTFKNNLLNWFVPGHILILDPYCGDDLKWHQAESIGNRIGLTGFYLVTKVNHKWDAVQKHFTTTLNTKWIASVTGNIRGRLGSVQTINSAPKSCAVNIFEDNAVSTSTSTTPGGGNTPPVASTNGEEETPSNDDCSKTLATDPDATPEEKHFQETESKF